MNGDQPSAGFDPGETSSFDQISRDVAAFEGLLNRLGITIAIGSPLERMAFDLLDLKRKQHELHTLDAVRDIRIDYRPALGLYDIVRRIIDLQNVPGFSVLIDHLRLLNRGTVAQNVTARTDQVSAKIFELLVGLICLKVGTDVEMDHPVTSYGDNPDILVTVNGQRWGFACKVLSGNSPLTFFDRLEEGIDQIERSPATKGCVVFNMKNQIDHDRTWPLLNETEYRSGAETPTFGAWRNVDNVVALLLELGETRQAELVKANSPLLVDQLFAGKKAIPGALLFLQTATAVQSNEIPSRPVMTTAGVFQLLNLGAISGADWLVLNSLNDAMHHRH